METVTAGMGTLLLPREAPGLVMKWHESLHQMIWFWTSHSQNYEPINVCPILTTIYGILLHQHKADYDKQGSPVKSKWANMWVFIWNSCTFVVHLYLKLFRIQCWGNTEVTQSTVNTHIWQIPSGLHNELHKISSQQTTYKLIQFLIVQRHWEICSNTYILTIYNI